LSELATVAQVLDAELNESLGRLAAVLQGFFAPHINAFAALEYQAVRYVLPPRPLLLVLAAKSHLPSRIFHVTALRTGKQKLVLFCSCSS